MNQLQIDTKISSITMNKKKEQQTVDFDEALARLGKNGI